MYVRLWHLASDFYVALNRCDIPWLNQPGSLLSFRHKLTPSSTPGQSLPSTDLITDPTTRFAFSAGASNPSDTLLQRQQLTPLYGGSASHIIGKIKAHISIPRIHHERRLSGSPRTNSVCLSFASATPSMLTYCSVSNRLYSIRPGC
jgi:hypothetical protein